MTDSLNVTFDDSLVDWSPTDDTGYSPQVAKEDTCDSYAAAGMVEFPDHLWIEPKLWKDVARENDKYKTWPDDWRNRFSNQSPTHECTSHALLQNMEIAWNRQRKSKKDAVYLSPISVYAEANPRQWGGASVQGVMRIAMRRGMLPEHHGPKGQNTQRELFQHTIHGTCGKGNATQSSGKWVPLKNFPPGWEKTSRHFKPIEVINIRSWEQHVCLVLHCICVSNGRSGHAIPHVKIVWRDGRANDPYYGLHSQYSDSYDMYRFDSIKAIKAGVDSAYGIVSTTRPDDWSRPAGADMKGAA